MSIKDSVLKFMRPIIAPYTTPRGAAAGILSLINPAAGALVRYGPDILSAMGSASSGQGPEQSGSRSRSRGMSGMMPLSGGSGRGFGAGGSGGLPLSDLTQYFQREPNLSNRRDAGVPYMNEGGEVMGFFTNMARQSAPGTRLMNPNMPPGPQNPYIPTRVSPPTGGPRLGQMPPNLGGPGPIRMPSPTGGRNQLGLGFIPPSSGPGPYTPRPFNFDPPARSSSGLGISSLIEQILARRRAANRIADRRQMQPPPMRMQEGGMIRNMRFIDDNGNGIDDRDEIVDEGIPVYAGGTPGFYDGTFDPTPYQDPVGMPIASAPPATQESLFGPDASAVMREAMLEYGGSRSPYEGFAEYFSRPVFDRSTPEAPPESTPTPEPVPVLGADDPRVNLDDRIAQLMDPNRQGLTREEALERQLRSIAKGYDINNDGVVTNAEFQMSMNPDFTGVDSRIQELMDRGMTRLQALANQSYGIQQGYDLNNDGMVTDAEYAEFMRAQEPGTVTTMPVGTPVPLVETDQQPPSTSPGQAFLNTLGTVQGATQAADASPPVADSVQQAIDGIRAQGIPGIFGGNFDLTALQKQIADYLESIGYQAPDDSSNREPMPRPPGGRRIISDPRRLTAIPPMNLPDSGGLSARIPASRK